MQDVARDVAADVGSDLQKGAQDATDVARAKLSDATGTAEPDRDGSGSPKLRQV
jgi:hypothetical protein